MIARVHFGRLDWKDRPGWWQEELKEGDHLVILWSQQGSSLSKCQSVGVVHVFFEFQKMYEQEPKTALCKNRKELFQFGIDREWISMKWNLLRRICSVEKEDENRSPDFHNCAMSGSFSRMTLFTLFSFESVLLLLSLVTSLSLLVSFCSVETCNESVEESLGFFSVWREFSSGSEETKVCFSFVRARFFSTRQNEIN